VRVADNGVGIREDELDRVFDRFHRSSNPAFHNVRGTGLGLYISRQLAQRHRGDLVVESSKLGAGTVFTLALPLSAAPTSD
jgi:signal transduction histidine kinase